MVLGLKSLRSDLPNNSREVTAEGQEPWCHPAGWQRAIPLPLLLFKNWSSGGRHHFTLEHAFPGNEKALGERKPQTASSLMVGNRSGCGSFMVKCRLSPIGSKRRSFRDSYPSKRLKHWIAGFLEKGCFCLTWNSILVIRKKVVASFLLADCSVRSTKGKGSQSKVRAQQQQQQQQLSKQLLPNGKVRNKRNWTLFP